MPMRPLLSVILAATLLPAAARAQGLTGALIGTVRDAQEGVVPGATVRIASPALIGGAATTLTNPKGQFVFLVLPPGRYVLDVEMTGLAATHLRDPDVTAGGPLQKTALLAVRGTAATTRR